MATIDRTRRAVPAQAGTRIPSAARDKRPALAALAVLLILGGALASGLLVYRSGGRESVLVASHDLLPGQLVGPKDLQTARVAAEGAQFVFASSERGFIGSTVTSVIPAGTMISSGMFRKAASSVPAGAEEVGINLAQGHLPARSLQQGDIVRIYRVGDEASGAADAEVLASATKVTKVTSGRAGAALISVIVPSDAAPALIQAASSTQVSVTLLPSGTKPQIDNR